MPDVLPDATPKGCEVASGRSYGKKHPSSPGLFIGPHITALTVLQPEFIKMMAFAFFKLNKYMFKLSAL